MFSEAFRRARAKPVSRILCPGETGAAIIPLVQALLPGSSDLPESHLHLRSRQAGSRRRIAERAAPLLLFGLAPCGVYPAAGITACAVRSYIEAAEAARTFSPLPRQARRYVFCGTFRTGSLRSRRSGIFFSPALAVSEHTALRSSDFPLPQRDQGQSVIALPPGQRPPGLLAQFHHSQRLPAGQIMAGCRGGMFGQGPSPGAAGSTASPRSPLSRKRKRAVSLFEYCAPSGLRRPSQRRTVPRPLAWALLVRPVGAQAMHSRCPAGDVGREQHAGGRGLFRFSGQGAYFSRAPLGTSSRNVASTGFPSSPSEAATTMPFDSTPRSLRG
jgi:hypothetical protein